ncbi:MAG: phosphoenolpyruvate-utilizing N-terminal domain-containing protein [Anaerolineaceae bacterium]
MEGNRKQIRLQGIAAAPGLASGVAWIFRLPGEDIIQRAKSIDPANEQERMDAAVRVARKDILILKARVSSMGKTHEAQIFEAHQSFLNDPALIKKVSNSIGQGWKAEVAWSDAINFFADQLKRIDDPLLQARAADVVDVGHRVLNHLLNRQDELENDPGIQKVIISEDLSPSTTVTFKKESVLAFCTATGSATSHASILARAMGIPAVVGLGVALNEIRKDDLLLVNGNTGEVIVNPSEEEVAVFQGQQDIDLQEGLRDRSQAAMPAITQDGRTPLVVSQYWQC